jgi:hypothetical protein
LGVGLFRSLKWLKLQGSKKLKLRQSDNFGKKFLRLQSEISDFFCAFARQLLQVGEPAQRTGLPLREIILLTNIK